MRTFSCLGKAGVALSMEGKTSERGEPKGMSATTHEVGWLIGWRGQKGNRRSIESISNIVIGEPISDEFPWHSRAFLTIEIVVLRT
jgi:hypothetical protein